MSYYYVHVICLFLLNYLPRRQEACKKLMSNKDCCCFCCCCCITMLKLINVEKIFNAFKSNLFNRLAKL